MSDGPRQLVLELPVETRFEADDFLIGPSNEAAFGRVLAWPHWPDHLLRLEGPTGSGKSHMAAIWAQRSGAPILPAASIRQEFLPALGEGPLAIEDLDRGPLAEAALFHLVNRSREAGRSVLLTSALSLEACRIRTPDLLSRLRLAPVVSLEPPDDALLRAVLVKLFSDRQLAVDANVVAYLAPRIERSIARARDVVAALDLEAMSRGRRVSRALAATILSAEPDFAEDE